MSTSPSSSTVIAAYELDLTNDYCVTATVALAAYEYMITFQHEYEFLSQRRWTAATWLFVANRYMLLASTLTKTIPTGAQSADSLSPTGTASLLGITLTIQYSARHVFRPFRFPPQCHTIGLIGILTTIISDIAAIVVTWLKTFQHVRRAASVGIGAGLGATLIQYGTLYFCVVLVVNILPLVTFLTPSLNLFTDGMTNFMTILPNILISRFLINLRQVDMQGSNDTIDCSRFSTTLNFRVPTLPEFIGNLGEPLANGDEDQDDEDQDDDTDLWGPCSSQLRDEENEDL
ncbi:hypothetical protein NM688_g3994 [Phlebia brevispora]|uniref:Uncharacterized protein n=1 Tax=Phlebia brevispora TaxID=194682 RepID=A0ACC1T4D8_9APHY|nr:hypothetical protein NM688_g3994 [Phlebia brevispora]